MTLSPRVALAEIIVVGLPFCAFKVLTGLALFTTVAPVSYLLWLIAGVDILCNSANLLSLALRGRRLLPVCLGDALWRWLARQRGWLGRSEDVGVALDVFLSFALVALVIGCGLLARLPGWGLSTWNLSVIFNVLGAGTSRLLGSLRA